MTTRARLMTACTLALLGCGGGGDGGNPARLYLALRGSETAVQLIGSEPEPF